MIALILLIVAVFIMVRVAAMENRSGLIWGTVTVVLCFANSAVIQFPFLDILMGLILSFVAMFVVKLIQNDSTA